jgi:Tfp pilus assembly protein PilO
MPFWRNDSKTYALIRRITPVQRFVLWALSILVPATVFLVLFYLPKRNRIRTLRKEYQSFMNQKNALTTMLVKLNKFKNENQKIEKQIKAEHIDDEAVEFLTGLIQKNDLSCLDMKPIKRKQQNIVQKNYYRIVVKGSFQACIDFFKDLADSTRFIKICELKMYRWKNQKIKCELVLRDVSIEI